MKKVARTPERRQPFENPPRRDAQPLAAVAPALGGDRQPGRRLDAVVLFHVEAEDDSGFRRGPGMGDW